MSSSSRSTEVISWIEWYCEQSGNEYFCEVYESYIEDRFNLTGLAEQVPFYDKALNMILDLESVDDQPPQNHLNLIEEAAKFLYGLIHARFIMTNAGIREMAEKWKAGHFEYCPRVYCDYSRMLPIGLSDVPRENMVKLYCPKCEEVYIPKSVRHHRIDGAYFGTGFPHMLFMELPELRPRKPTNQFVQKLYGFKIHSSAYQIQRQASKVKTPIRLSNFSGQF